LKNKKRKIKSTFPSGNIVRRITILEMSSKIMKAVEMEVNKRLEWYLLAFIRHNYEHGAKNVDPNFVPPGDEEIESHIKEYMRATPFTLEDKVVEKKRMGRPKKNEKETILADDNALEVSNMCPDVSEQLDHVGEKEKEKVEKAPKEKAVKVPKENVEKAPKEKKEKAVKEKVEKAPKEKKEKVVKEKVEKAPKEKKEKVEKAPKEKKEKAEKAPKEKKEKVKKEKADGEKKRGRPKKTDEQKGEDDSSGDESEVETVEPVETVEQVKEQLAAQLQLVEESIKQAEHVVAEEIQQLQRDKQLHEGQQVQDQAKVASINAASDDVEFEDYLESPKSTNMENIVKFTDKTSGKDLYIDKNTVLENAEDDGQVWYAVKELDTHKEVGRSNLVQFQEYDDDDEDDDEEEEEENDDDEDDDEDDEED